ncbi:nucleoside-diphosphate sugar epimerase/dehydratase [Marvinbryantia formatexigens]|uniref:nucleoside-diphosphate sugar epimerase/dehydratase n=2 Tax=Marvinbryantia formatexigens TaxID=168384 RepID=UPI000891E3C7|nr:nucleoside-diphosphate sugar epimerase/dehydratase [Marvinbryantia formatexigens]SDG70846.1 NDP-sugar epimerase, includes UDP-GlcNAc-inverting 4,6-dehydratase FlaA1 and capsular polysaccharide biosynthesis protein EpsC [Marvinbryantia formatexigens]
MREEQKNGKQVSGQTKEKKHRFQHWEVIALYLVLYDVVAACASYFFALLLRFDMHVSQIPPEYLDAFVKFMPFYAVFMVAVFYALRLYSSIWQFASFSELNRITVASLATAVFHTAGITLFLQRMPVSYYIIGAVMQYCLVIAVRFSYRYITMERARRRQDGRAVRNAMIIGAGAAGQVIIRELKNSGEAEARPCCVIDDNPNKWGRLMEGIPVAGGRDSIPENVRKYKIDQILFAIPTASAEDRRAILDICKETGCELKSLPGVYQLANGEVSLSRMKPVAVEELLGRDPIKVNMEEIFRYIKGKTILVTGGGGSIGSELCRQIAGHEPGQLVIFDIYENNAYDIEQELRRKYPDLKLSVLIGSVRDSRRINQVFETYKPDIVYHAAAHKHVPLMETSPNEAIKNNVVGTYKTAYAALKNGTQRFVLISTDKAVNPTNIMGASKRLCEMVIQSMDAISKAGRMDLLPFLHAHMDKQIDGQIAHDPEDHMAVDGMDGKHPGLNMESVKNGEHPGTQFVAVRFGNVLGSNGSVIPLFKKQIEAGGPVTVTHPDIIRYFMTIPEAVSLVLQAGTYAWGGEIFVLDMGEPVKIDTLARNLIKLSGYKPDEDIKIVYTGLRPGEKLFEEKLMAEEGLKKTDNDLIHIGKPVPFDVEKFLRQLEELAKASYENSGDIVGMVEQMVTTFHPAGKHPEKIIAGPHPAADSALDEVAAAKEMA